MNDELTTLMHYEFFEDEYTKEEFLCLGVYGAIQGGMKKEDALKKYGIEERFYNQNIERILLKP